MDPSTNWSLRARRPSSAPPGTLSISIPNDLRLQHGCNSQDEKTMLANELDGASFFACADTDGKIRSLNPSLDDSIDKLPPLPNAHTFDSQFKDQLSRSLYLASLFSSRSCVQPFPLSLSFHTWQASNRHHFGSGRSIQQRQSDSRCPNSSQTKHRWRIPRICFPLHLFDNHFPRISYCTFDQQNAKHATMSSS